MSSQQLFAGPTYPLQPRHHLGRPRPQHLLRHILLRLGGRDQHLEWSRYRDNRDVWKYYNIEIHNFTTSLMLTKKQLNIIIVNNKQRKVILFFHVYFIYKILYFGLTIFLMCNKWIGLQQLKIKIFLSFQTSVSTKWVSISPDYCKKTHHCKTLTEWVVFTKLFSTQSVVGSSLNSSSKCWAKCVSLYYLWVAAPTNLVVSATGLTLPTFPTLSRATSTQPIGSGVVRKRVGHWVWGWAAE